MSFESERFSLARLLTARAVMIGSAALGLSLLWAADASTAESSATVAKPIEQVQAGDRVLSRDEATGELVLRPVVETFVRTSDHLRLLTLRTSRGLDEQIETTDEHPFWVAGAGWTDAKALQTGQRLVEPDGSITTVVASTRVEHPDGVTVYNFEVADTHSYFVAARGSRGPPVWVHNADYGNTPTTIRRVGANPNAVEIPVGQLNPIHPVPRIGKEADIPTLKKLIMDNGYDVSRPVSATRLPNGDLIVTGGHHRLEAMKQLNQTTVPVRIYDAATDPVRTARNLGIGRITGKYVGDFMPTLTPQQQQAVNAYLKDWRKANGY